MPVTPIQRLVDELAHVQRREYPALAKRAGVVVREIERAAAGTQLRPGQYLKLCAALGIKAATGERVPPRRLGDFDWGMFRLGVEMRRRLSKRMNMRQAVAAIGHRVGLSTMSRVANAKPVSITSVIAICEWIGTEPEQYCADPDAPKFHVKPKSQTNEGGRRETLSVSAGNGDRHHLSRQPSSFRPPRISGDDHHSAGHPHSAPWR